MVKPGGRLVYATCSLDPRRTTTRRVFIAGHGRHARPASDVSAMQMDADGALEMSAQSARHRRFTAVRFRRD